MVRTSSAGIKISSGKSSKKGGGGGGSSSNTSRSSSTSSRSSSGSTRLPPIPHQETPSWQKPITNFFRANTNPLDTGDCKENGENGSHIEDKSTDVLSRTMENESELKTQDCIIEEDEVNEKKEIIEDEKIMKEEPPGNSKSYILEKEIITSTAQSQTEDSKDDVEPKNKKPKIE